jgi:hypothetical protein
MTSRFRFVVLSAGLLLSPISAFAQSVTTEPLAAVPTTGVWTLFALALTLLAGAAWWLHRNGHARAAGAVVLVAAVFGSAPIVWARIGAGLSFTNPNGETIAMPIERIYLVGTTIDFWNPVFVNNESGFDLRIADIDLPTFDECFPSGVDETIDPTPQPSVAPTPQCAENAVVAAGDRCYVNVDARCRSLASAAPAIFSSVSPNTGSTAGGTVVTISGTNLQQTTGVTFGGVPATSFAVDDATTITAVTPAHAAGTVSISLASPGGSSTGGNVFTYVAGP